MFAGSKLTKLFQLSGSTLVGVASSSASLSLISWPLSTPVIIERMAFYAAQATTTVGNRVAGTVVLAAGANQIGTLPPNFPSVLPGDWGFDALTWQIDFAANESQHNFKGDQVRLIAGDYTLTTYAIGTFAINDVVDWHITIYYREP